MNHVHVKAQNFTSQWAVVYGHAEETTNFSLHRITLCFGCVTYEQTSKHEP